MPDFLRIDFPFAPLVFMALGVVVMILWIFQFAKLMALPDDAFPGAYVRFGWVAAFVVLFFFAPFAFLVWNAQRPVGRKSTNRA
ncbi:MAG TPA: hypothetical protein PKE00_11255 [Planctomycetota bacterium]|nr:hypothetical protein [Planctomycetota bacterium]